MAKRVIDIFFLVRYATRLPDPYMTGVDRLAMPFHMGAAPYGDPSAGAYNQMYPQDELSMIKMRNRRLVALDITIVKTEM